MSDRAIVSSVDLETLRVDGDAVGTVGMPIRDSINVTTMRALMQTDWPGAIDRLWAKGNVLTLQRNNLVQRMRGDWILFIDDDMVWQPDAVRRLVATKDALEAQGYTPDVLGALCFRRAAPHQPTLYLKHKNGSYNFMETWEDDVVEVDATGMAFALITKAAFERIAGTEMPPFEDRRAFNRTPDFFRWLGSLGEDLRFCEDVKTAGGSIYVDTRIKIGHMAEKEIGVRDFWREVADRSQEDEDHRRVVNDQMGMETMDREQARKLYDR